MAGKTTIQTILHNPRLPSLPAVAIKVLELTRDENVNFREVADVIEYDQALAVKIIRTVNSSYFGLSRPCTSINQAIIFLGIEAVKTLVLGFSLVDSIDGSSEYDVGFDYATYWRRALHSAVAAREIARLSSTCDPEEAFLAALIQDVGMVALHRAFRDVYVQILDLTGGFHSRLIPHERQSIEMDHAEVGAAIAEMWKLPPQLVTAIRHHHEADASPQPGTDLARIVELAGHVAEMLWLNDTDMATASAHVQPPARFNTLMREWVELDESASNDLLSTVEGAAAELAALFKVELSAPMAVDQALGEAEDRRIERELVGRRSAFGEQRPTLTCRSSTRSASHDDVTMTANESPTAIRGAGHIVGPATFRRQLRAAIAEAKSSDGCVGLLACALATSSETPDEADTTASAERLAEEVGGECVVTANGLKRALVCIPRADHVIVARLAHTMRSRLGTPAPELHDGVSMDAGIRLTNIGAAAYEHSSRAIVTDERKLILLAEQALNLAISAGPGAIRIFDPKSTSEQAA